MSDFVLTSMHEVYFNNDGGVPIDVMAESLLALDRIIRMSPRVLTALTDVAIRDIEVFVEELHSGSLKEHILVRLFFENEAELDKFLQKVREHLGKPGMTRSATISLVLLTLVGMGAWYAAKATNSPTQTTIEANNNVIIAIGADQAKLEPETLRAIIEAAIPDKKELADSAVKFFKPARPDGKAGISMDGIGDITFPPEVIAATPQKLEIPKQEKTELLPDVDLHVRATNLDSRNTGWAALIPGKVDKRIKLKLDPSVEIEHVAGKYTLRANVALVYRFDNQTNRMVPDYILLRDVIQD